MKFFQSKKKVTTRDFRARADDPTAALKEELDAAIVPALKAKEKTPDEISETTKVIKKIDPVKKASGKSKRSKKGEPEAEIELDKKPAGAEVTAAQIDNMRLFPGFEDQGFEIGYAAYSSKALGLNDKAPMLLVRWKTSDSNTDWFPIPPMFNKVLLTRIHERDHDLDRLLLDYGYDAEQLATARKSEE